MSANLTILPIKTTRQLLKQWHQPHRLGEHELAESEMVQQRMLQAGYGETIIGRGLALRDLLQEGIDTLQPPEGVAQEDETAWRGYRILHEQFVSGRRPDWLIQEMALARRTYFAEQKQALEQLGAYVGDKLSKPDNGSSHPHHFVETGVSRVVVPPMPKLFIEQNGLKQTVLSKLLSGTNNIALHGLPGVGKTTLATILVHHPEIQSHFPDGILWAGLGITPNNPTILAGWGRSLGIDGRLLGQNLATSDWANAIHRAIGERKMLIVVDDAWTLEDAVLFQLGGSHCVHLLTTRFPKVAMQFAEHVLAVTEMDTTAGVALLKALAPEAVAFSPDKAVSLVKQLGGLPLAMQLSGQYLRGESFGGQSGRLTHAWEQLASLELPLNLQQPQSPLMPHTSLAEDEAISLQRLINLSEKALSPVGQQALISLGCLPPKPASFSLETAQATAGLTDPYPVYELIDYGLLEPVAEERYTLHQSISYFLQKKLESDSKSVLVKQRLVSHVTEFVEVNRKKILHIEQNYSVIQTGLQVAEEMGLSLQLVTCIHNLFGYIENRGLHDEGDRLVKVLRKINTADPLTHTLVLVCRGHLALLLRQNAEAETLLMAARDSAESIHDRRLIADINLLLGQHYLKVGNMDKSERLYEFALETGRELKDLELEANALTCLGLIIQNRGHLGQTLPIYSAALALWNDMGLNESTISVRFNMGTVLQQLGRFDEARLMLENVLGLVRQDGNRWLEGRTLNNLGIVYKNTGAWAHAREIYKTAIRLMEEGQHHISLTLPWGNLGTLCVLMGDYEAAEFHYEHVRQVANDLQIPLIEGRALESLAHTKLSQGQIAAGEDFARAGAAIGENAGDIVLQSISLYQLGQGALMRRAWAEAADFFTQVVELTEESGKQSLHCEAKGRLALIQFKQGSWEAARREIKPILDFLEDKEAAVSDPVQHYLVGYKILTACGEDGQARVLLDVAKDYVRRQSRQLPDGRTHSLFLNNVASHRELMTIESSVIAESISNL